jgi:hypothetical protein
MQKIDLKPGEAILMPAERENRAKQYLDLQNLDRQPVGRYLLYRFQIKPALRKPIDPSG